MARNSWHMKFKHTVENEHPKPNHKPRTKTKDEYRAAKIDISPELGNIFGVMIGDKDQSGAKNPNTRAKMSAAAKLREQRKREVK